MAKSEKKAPAYKNPAEPVEERVADLLSRMTLEQKVSQMHNSAGEGERACRLYRSKQGEIPVCLWAGPLSAPESLSGHSERFQGALMYRN